MPSYTTPKQCVLNFLPTISFLNRIGAFEGNEKNEISQHVAEAAKDPRQWIMVRDTLIRIQKGAVNETVQEYLATAIEEANQNCENY